MLPKIFIHVVFYAKEAKNEPELPEQFDLLC